MKPNLFIFLSLFLFHSSLAETQPLNIEITLVGADGKSYRNWVITERSIVYFEECHQKGVSFQKKSSIKIKKEISRILIQLDSLGLNGDYGCQSKSSIHGENKFKIFSTFTYNNKEGHINLSISNCFLNFEVNELITQINRMINEEKVPKIPLFQVNEADCSCEKYLIYRIYDN